MSDPGAVEEHRLALVMNGGVSLAVWMGGVAAEIDMVRRASSGLTGPDEGTDGQSRAQRRVFELWREHAQRVGTRVSVDVIAGTSAGGLNGVLLATAIANGTQLTPVRALWMTASALSNQALLTPQGPDPASVLNGDFFLDQIRHAVAALRDRPGDAANNAADNRPDERRDVDLTTTATAVDGAARAVHDSAGARFTEPDHRRRFRFQRVAVRYHYTGDRASLATPVDPPLDDFAAGDAVSLAGRASASFPVAFAPVTETAELRRQRAWPTWAKNAALNRLADGGILDNAPFQPVLDAIAAQPVEATWRRTLCYVVPSAEELAATSPAAPAGDFPPPWTKVLGTALTAPTEADLRDDVEQTYNMLRAGRSSHDVYRFTALLADAAQRDKYVQLATAGFDLYAQSRGAAAIYEIRDTIALGAPEAYLDPETGVQPGNREIKGTHPWLPAPPFPAEIPTEWTWGLAPASRLVAVLIRSLAHENGPAADALRYDLSQTAARVSAVRSAVVDALIGAASEHPFEAPITKTVEVADRVFGGLHVPEILAELLGKAVSTYAAQRGVQPVDVLHAALCIEVVNGLGGVPIETKASPIFDFLRLGVTAMPNVLAVPEADPHAGGKRPSMSNILYGTRLNHFAAFAREEWRAWDFLWGRIHAAVQLAPLLGVSREQVGELVEQIVYAEGQTPDQVRERIPEVMALSKTEVLTDVRTDKTARLAADSLFALLGSRLETNPGVPPEARWVAALAGRRRPQKLSVAQWLARVVVAPGRLLARRKLQL